MSPNFDGCFGESEGALTPWIEARGEAGNRWRRMGRRGMVEDRRERGGKGWMGEGWERMEGRGVGEDGGERCRGGGEE